MGDLGAFRNITSPFDSPKLEESIDKKVVSICRETDCEIKEYYIEKQIFVITSNRDICLDSTVYIIVTDQSDNEIKTGAAIITIIRQN